MRLVLKRVHLAQPASLQALQVQQVVMSARQERTRTDRLQRVAKHVLGLGTRTRGPPLQRQKAPHM